MRSHPSFDTFASVLAALGASAVIAACGGATPQPVQANEVTPVAAAAPGAPAANMAAAPPVSAAAETAPAATPAPATTVAEAPVAAEPAKPAPVKVKPVAKKAAPKADPGAEASCGAGTCSGDAKKKIL